MNETVEAEEIRRRSKVRVAGAGLGWWQKQAKKKGQTLGAEKERKTKVKKNERFLKPETQGN